MTHPPRESSSCPRCGAFMHAAAAFCGACGSDASGGTSQPGPRVSSAARRAPPTEAHATPLATPRQNRARRSGPGTDHDWKQLLGALRLWILLLVTAVLTGVVAGVCESDSPAFDALGDVAIVALLVPFVVRERALLRPMLTHSGFTARTWWMPLALWLGLSLAMAGWFALLHGLGAEIFRFTDDFVAHGWPIASIYLMDAVTPGVVEEVALRGIVQGRLGRVMSERHALIAQAAMFSVLHLLPLSYPSHFVIGLALGWLRNRTNSLYPGMLVHMAFNALGLTDELTVDLFA